MDSDTSPRLPWRYDVTDYPGAPFWPFLVAPLQESQQTVVVGPSGVDVNRLIAVVDGPVGDGPVISFSGVQSLYCVAMSFPSSAPDNANRVGLTCTLGLLAPYGACPRDLARYLSLLLQRLCDALGIDLLRDGSKPLVEPLYRPESRRDITTPLLDAMRNVLLLGQLAARESRFGRSSALERLRRYLARVKRPPRVILYDPAASTVDLIEILATEIGSGRVHLRPTEGAGATVQAGLILVPLPGVTGGMRKVRLRVMRSGRRYVLFS